MTTLTGRARRSGNERRWGANTEADDRQLWPPTFAELHVRFRFTVDVAASDQNHQLPRYYTARDNGLEQTWAGERVWCNPPYSTIRPWVERAWDDWDADTARPYLVVMLLPANRTEQTWWHELVEERRRRPDFDVEFLRGRQRFLKPGETTIGHHNRPPFGCCLLIWGA